MAFPRDETGTATFAEFALRDWPLSRARTSQALCLNSQGESAAPAPNIRALTHEIRRGDAEAFSRFYDLYSLRLYKYLLVLARGDENEAREVCQSVMIKLAKRFAVFEEEGKLWAWLATLAKNAYIDHLRARERRSRFTSIETAPPTPDLAVEIPHRLSENLREVLASLPPEERELIQAAYIDDCPLAELAAKSGWTYKAVENRLARLRHKLKEQLLKQLRHENQS